MQAEKGLSTASMVTRWREAHPKEAGTEKVSLASLSMSGIFILSSLKGLVLTPVSRKGHCKTTH